MTPSLELQIDRLAGLIRRAGPEALFAAPFVTPDDTWFPDPWSKDLECVHRVGHRLAEYAGLVDLDVEIVTLPEPGDEAQLPAALLERRTRDAPASSYWGIHEGRAWFEVESSWLNEAELLVAVLASEMARAWREARDIHEKSPREEAECVEVTAIMLGFGTILCNASAPSTSIGKHRVSSARGQWQEHWGLLDSADIAGLLACWAQAKDIPKEEVERWLPPDQATQFHEAWELLAELDMDERLGITGIPHPASPPPEGASRREFTPSLAATRVHECVKRLVELAGDDGGLAPAMVRFPVPEIALPHREVASWGRVMAREIWTRSLVLVADPEWDTQAVVVVAHTGNAVERVAVGHVRDRQTRDKRSMREWLLRLFAGESPFRILLVPSLPTYVALGDDHSGLGMDGLQSLFRPFADDADPDRLAIETTWLREHQTKSTTRLVLEREAGDIPLLKAERVDSQDWWAVVSNRAHVADELTGAPMHRASGWFQKWLQSTEPAGVPTGFGHRGGGAR